MTKGEIIAALPALAKDDLIDLQRRIGAMLQFASVEGPPTATAETNADLVLDAITSVLQERGAEFVNAAALRRSRGYNAFSGKCDYVIKYLGQATKNRNKQRALLHLSVRLLYDDMLLMGVAVSSRTIMAHIHRVPAVINKSFPGYSDSGMLGMIIGERHVSPHV